MKRFLLTSCATGLVMTVMAGNSALAQSYTVPTGSTQEVTGPITDNGSTSTSVSVTGGGTVILDGINSYTGTTSVAASSQLIISTDAALGNTQLAGTSGTANTINLGDSTASASLTIKPGVSSFSSGRNVNLNAGGGIINGVTTPGGSAVFSGIFSGGGALSINSGTVELTNVSNTYVGGTYIKGNATLQVTDDTVLGGGQATNVVLGDNGTDGKGTNATGGTLSFINSAAVSSFRTIVIEDGGGTILTNSAAEVTLTGIIANNGDTTSRGGLTVGGNGTLSLQGTNTFLGDVTVQKGATLAINNDNALGAYTSVTNQVTGQVTNTPNSNTDGSLALNTLHLQGGKLQFTQGATILHNITTDAVGSTIDTNDFNAVVSSNISGSGDLTKTGAGILTLNGTNSYTGGTTISEGALIVGDSAHPNATLAGDVTINGNGTGNLSTTITSTTTTNSSGTSVTTNTTGNAILGGSGTIAGTVINNGGIVAPANTLTVGGYIQNSNAILAPEITPSTTTTSASELKVTGTATIGGGTLSVGYGSGFLRAGQYQIFTASSISGSGFSTVNAGVVPSAGLTADVVQEGNSYYVVLTQKTDLPDHPTVLPSLTQATIDQAQQ
ncbi:MAG TPA: autotransporter-associated beta strand repeat-containing protein, partial [Magnetospirillaceae bacterium]|nr:autotransporter-associated beta strand repeat-containing protein [Magnetospirillaceae bacterium]